MSHRFPFSALACESRRFSRDLTSRALPTLVLGFLGLAVFWGVEAVAQSPAATTTSIAVTSSGNPVTTVGAGTVVTLAATVNSGASSVIQGQVNFCDASANFCTDIHLLGTAQLTSAGTATLKLRPGIGGHSYKAVFVGTSSYTRSPSSASSLIVNGGSGPFATTTAIAQNGSWGTYTLTGTVTETGGTVAPSGDVSFLDTSSANSILGQGALGAATGGLSWLPLQSPGGASLSTAAAGDFNGDGIPDLAVLNWSAIEIFLGNGDGTFTEVSTTLSTTSAGGNIAASDFNNDGNLDLAVSNPYSNTVTIFLGHGDGTFTQTASAPATGSYPVGVAVADFNGDGNADLAIANESNLTGNSSITILLGNGDGTFTPASASPAAGAGAYAIVAADFNSDGKIDLAVTDEQESTLTILLGNGDGTFTAASSPAVTSYADAIASADFNGDGKPDLIVGCENEGLIIVLLGNGDGTFTPAPAFPEALSDPIGIAVADFNLDGIPDVAIPDQALSGGVVTFTGKGDGTFAPSSSIPSSPAFLVAADFNGDGRPDFAIPGNLSGKLQAYITEPTETATASATVTTTTVGQHLVDATFDGDSSYTSSTSGTTQLWGPPPATTTSLSLTANGSSATSVTPGTVVTLTVTVTAGTSPVMAGQVDFCDDSANTCSDIHLLASVALPSNGTAAFKFVPGPGTHSYKALYVENGYGLPSSSAAASLTVGPASPVVYSDSVAVSDGGFPGDYSLTAIVTGFGGSAAPTGNVSFVDTSFGNTSLGTAALGSSAVGIRWLISQTQATGSDPVAEVVGDFNQDGIPDIAVLWSNNASGGPYPIMLFAGRGDGTFVGGTSISTGIGISQSAPYMVVGDFNGDGKTDLAILTMGSTSFTNSVTVLLSNGDGTFAAPQTSGGYNLPNSGGDVYGGAITAADFNGDGKLDLAIVGDCVASCGVTILLGNGNGTFGTGTTYDSTQSFGQIATGDFNGDGIPDLVVTNYFEFGGGPTIFLGKGDGTFTSSTVSFPLDYFPTSIVVGDFNGDGVLDLAFSDLNGVEIALGNGDGTFTETAASPISVPSELYSLVAGDFNRDGKLDLAGVDNYNDRIVLLTGARDGTFTVTPTTPAVNQVDLGPFAIAAADFNEDGVPDLAMLSKYTPTASILIDEPTVTTTATVTGIAPIGAGVHNVEAGYAGDSNYSSGVSSTMALTAGLAPLVLSPASGPYSSPQTLTISEPIPGATIYYETFGPISTNGAFVPYTGSISLNIGGTESIQAYATETGYQQSNDAAVNYSLNFTTAGTPVILPAAGSYASAQSVTITDATSGATVYYTTDGSNPTTNSTVYVGPITVASSETIKAVAVVTGSVESAVASAAYTINAPTPTLSNLSPAFVVAGSAAFSLTINGTGFMPNSTAYWGTAALTTQYVSASQLKAQISAAQVATAGVNGITVQTPAPDGGTSNTMQFEVDSAGSTTPPSFTTPTASVNPGSTASYSVTIPSSARNVSVNCLNLPTGATCSYSASSGTLTIATSSTTPTRTYQITVVFTETLPGGASALIFVPLLLLPLVAFRKARTMQQAWFMVILALALTAVAVSGCGGGSSAGGGTTPPTNPTHQATSSGTVTLTIQ